MPLDPWDARFFEHISPGKGLPQRCDMGIPDAGRTLAMLTLWRHTGPFSRAELQHLRRASSYLAQLLRPRPTPSTGGGTGIQVDSALLIVDRNGQLRHGSAQAWALLHQAADVPSSAPVLLDAHCERTRDLITRLLRAVEQRLPTHASHTLHTHTAYGRFSCQAQVLCDAQGASNELISVHIRREADLI